MALILKNVFRKKDSDTSESESSIASTSDVPSEHINEKWPLTTLIGGKKDQISDLMSSSFSIKKTLEIGICKMGGLIPVIVVMLRDTTVDRIFSMISLIPGGGIVALIGNTLLRNTIDKIIEIINDNGEPYLMNIIASIWKDKNITYHSLIEGINKIPSMAVSESVKTDSLNLVDKYYICDCESQDILDT